MTKKNSNPDDKHDILVQAAAARCNELRALLARIPQAAQQAGDPKYNPKCAPKNNPKGSPKDTPKIDPKVNQKLRISMNHGRPQYYITSDDPKASRRTKPVNGKYVPKAEIQKARAIAQRDYNSAAAATLKKAIGAIERFLAAFHPGALDKAFTGLHPGRRSLVTPLREPDADYIASWQHLPDTSKPFEINAPEYITSKGERVRSKSEIIIADALSRAGIPYRYEYPTSVKGWGTLYPDFTCLDTRTREEIIWEHFGLMHDREYAEQTVQKIARYAASGYTLGKNFIATFEANTSPLSIKQVQGYINTLFKSRAK